MERRLVHLFICAALFFAACTEKPHTTSTPTAPTPLVPKDTVSTMRPDGMQEIAIPGGGKMVGRSLKGIRQGQWVSYFENGAIRSRATYVDGLRNGPVEVYHENGMTYYSGQYLNDKAVGDWIFFDLNGTKLKRVQYDSLGTVVRQEP